jgi:UDP-N-acetyl-D-mannosaminuronate dehydrogenase
MIMTDHTKVDYALVANHAALVFDARNAMDGRAIEMERSKLIKI